MDILSVILGFVSILQNLRKEQKLEDRVKSLSKALDQVTAFYEVLQWAKSVHDDFEKFMNVALRPLKQAIDKNDREHYPVVVQQLLDYEHRFMRTSPGVELRMDTSDASAGQHMASVKRSLAEMVTAHKKLRDLLVAFEKSINALNEHNDDKGFGQAFLRTATAVEQNAISISQNADIVLVNAANVLDFIHYENKKAVAGLAS